MTIQTKKFRFRTIPLFHKIQEGEWVSEGVVIYGKKPFMVSDLLGMRFWEHALIINLWFFTLQFNWIKSEDTEDGTTAAPRQARKAKSHTRAN